VDIYTFNGYNAVYRQNMTLYNVMSVFRMMLRHTDRAALCFIRPYLHAPKEIK